MAVHLERLGALIEFAKQSALLKASPVQTVAQHRLFNRFEERLRALPGLTLNGNGGEDEVWLRLERLHETRPPALADKVTALYADISNTPSKPPVLHPRVERAKLVEAGALPPPKKDEDVPAFVALDDFAGKASVEAHFKAYCDGVWKKWSVEEIERRRSIALYGELFMLGQQLQGSIVDAPLELVWGVGIALWESATGLITYPLLTQLVEIALNEETMALEVRPRAVDPRLEADSYAALEHADVVRLEVAAKDLLRKNESVINPFERSTFEPLLRSAAVFLDGHGRYWPDHTKPEDRSLPKADENLCVTDTWVLFARPRTASLFVQDLERLEKALADGAPVPAAAAAVVTEPSAEQEDVELPSFRGLSFVSGTGSGGSALGRAAAQELFFPLPYNEEQVHIAQLLDVHDGVVVQGPPGTGKTHTIANIICHYLALGKRVLVTSMKDPALAVLQEKLPEDIRPLAISLLTSEAEGMKQFEFAINKIAGEVQRLDKFAYRNEIARLDREIDELHAKIAQADREIARWAALNLQPFSVDGEELRATDAAAQVALQRQECAWLTDELSIESRFAPQFNNEDISALRQARLTVGEDLAYLGKRLPQLTAFPDSAKLLQLHQDLSRFAHLAADEQAGKVPALVDSSAATAQWVVRAIDEITALRTLWLEARGSREDWVPRMEALVRSGGKVDLRALLETLIAEVGAAVQARAPFFAKPVELPAGFERNPELATATENLAQGKSAFGIAGWLGKSAEKRLLESVRVAAARCATAEDWVHVRAYLSWQQQALALVTRWNVLADELPLPRLEAHASRLPAAHQAGLLYRSLQGALEVEKTAVKALRALFPGWTKASAIAQPAVLDQAASYLAHYAARFRLSEAWSVKESFLNAASGCSGAIVDQLNSFFAERVGNPAIADSEVQTHWSALMAELRRVLDLRPALNNIERATAAIAASGAPRWAAQLHSQPYTGAHDALLPDNWESAWRLRRLVTHLDSIDGSSDLKRLSRHRTELEGDLAKRYRDSVHKRTWLKLAENATHEVRAALEAYRSAIKKIGKGTGKRAVRYRQDARTAADRASRAVPCWIMPHYRVCESLPPALGCFDLVIIDEASQSDLTALPAILRAKKLLIVGDDKQVSPEGVGLEEDKVRHLMTRHLAGQVDIYRPLMTPERSIYDLFKVVFSKSGLMLREHFRCVAPIIEYSKREFYNHELKPLRLPRASERMDPPLVDVVVLDGYRHGDINIPEARFIVDEIRRMIEDGHGGARSVGVVSLVGNEQALRVAKMLVAELGEEIMTRYQIACGDARTFQGKERDVMFVSMVVDPNKVTAQGTEMIAQRYNVAASRARNRMYLVRSVGLEDLSPADTLRRQLIEHFRAPFAQDPKQVASLREHCESPFEREVFDVLTERGYRVTPQVEVGVFRIDMVVEGDNDHRLAIECDGDRYHGPEQWDADMRRQRILERAGWRFWRCFASTFVLQRDRVVADLVQTLAEHGVHPASNTETVAAESIHVMQRPVRAMDEHETWRRAQQETEDEPTTESDNARVQFAVRLAQTEESSGPAQDERTDRAPADWQEEVGTLFDARTERTEAPGQKPPRRTGNTH